MNKKGFTLIEIIIVIVILGVLATLALPRLSAQVGASEAAEAMQFFGAIKRAAMSCYDSTNDFTLCNRQSSLSVSVPATTKFTYSQLATASAISFWAVSTSNTANYIMMTVAQDGKTLMATPTSTPYIGIVSKVGRTTASVAPGTAAAF